MSQPVLLAVGGPAENLLVTAASRMRGTVTVTRRCADVGELLAAAGAGLGRVAVVALDLPGFGPEEVAALRSVQVALVVVVGPAQDGRRLLGLGADQVSGAPADVGEAAALLDQASRLVPGPAAPAAAVPARPGDGRLVVVWGPTGAPGRSTVAINLAAELASRHGPALLVDADTYGGSLAQMLGVTDEASGLVMATRAAARGRLDPATLAGLATVVRPDLSLLTGTARADRWPELGAASLGMVWSVARRLARWVVVDTGFCLESDEALIYDTHAPSRNAATRGALRAADVVVVVGSGDPIGLARLVRGLGELRDAGLGARRAVVVNRVRASVLGQRPERTVRSALARHAGVRDALVVPDDAESFDRSLRDATTLAQAAPASPARQAVAALADRVVAITPAPPPAPPGAPPARPSGGAVWGTLRRCVRTFQRRWTRSRPG